MYHTLLRIKLSEDGRKEKGFMEVTGIIYHMAIKWYSGQPR